MLTLLWLALVFVALGVLLYTSATGIAWTLAFAGLLALSWTASLLPFWLNVALTALFVVAAVVLNVVPLRRTLLSDRILAVFRKVMPPMSQTERDAIEAGTVWWDAELFSGRPNWAKLLGVPLQMLTKAQVIRKGLTLGLDYGLTHSCYDPGPEGRPCGRCDSCTLRAAGFAQAGVADPILVR